MTATEVADTGIAKRDVAVGGTPEPSADIEVIETNAAGVDVSVILPVHNEEINLEREVARIRTSLDASEYSYEIIVINDASTDRSAEILEQIDDVRVITFRTNRGTGTGRKAGTLAARGKVVVWTDCDLTYPNDEIPQLVKSLDGYDQVVGARTSEEGTLKALRVPAKWSVRMLAQFLVGEKIPDLNSGFRAFRRDVALQYLHMLPKGFSCVTTLTLSFLTGGYTVGYVPIEYKPRSGRSKFHPIKDTQRYLTQVVRMVLSYNPLRFFGPLSALLLLAGLGKLGFDVVSKDFRVATNTLIVLFAGLQLLVTGLLADLVVRVTRRDTAVPPAST
jgi:glycosyltransferase involved in cell wall biosynthesis